MDDPFFKNYMLRLRLNVAKSKERKKRAQPHDERKRVACTLARTRKTFDQLNQPLLRRLLSRMKAKLLARILRVQSRRICGASVTSLLDSEAYSKLLGPKLVVQLQCTVEAMCKANCLHNNGRPRRSGY
ncbi:hypothetical protein BC826DRAFT_1179920 [Russula brevipes]|nr:hypothetical protein BC826DRAFT_1179920 [Russula brevipes]